MKAKHEGALFKIGGVVGAGIGLSDQPGRLVIEVYVEKATPEVRAAVPSALDGVPVRVVETGKFTSHY